MDIIQFIKIIRKNIFLLMIVPVLLGGIVWYLTKDEIKMYQSDTVVYTGIAAGLSMEQLGRNKVDLFGSKIEYDNITNILKARETHKEVALRLYAQGLSLNSWDSRYISRENFLRLHRITPQYIKDLVIKQDTTNFEDLLRDCPMILNDTAGLSNKELIYSNVYHYVKRGEDLPTLSKIYNVPVSDLMNWNDLVSTRLEMNQELIVQRLHKVVYNYDLLTKDTIDLFIPDPSYFVKTKIDSSSFERSVESLREYTDANDTNFLYKLLNSKNEFYGLAAIANSKASRVQGSDLIKITYASPDPGITKQTLQFFVFSFQKYYRKLKENQSDRIVAYFEKRVNESSALLIAAENKLLNFNQDNNIINYYEQTRHISDQKEQLDKSYYDEKMKFDAAEAVIKHIEEKLQSIRGITAINIAVLEQRNALADITYKIAINELNDNKDPKAVKEIEKLRDTAEVLKKEIVESLDSIFNKQYSAEGVNQNDLLSSWLEKTIEYEQSKATLAALYERKKEFQRTYEIFAPLGAKLTRIEREINIYEKQYLQHLNSLNQAKLKQQNLEFKSNIKVIDPPYLPLKPEGSKRMLFIAAAVIVGFVMVLFTILALEYLDQTMKMPQRAESFVGLRVTTAYPVFKKRQKSINYDYLRRRAVQFLHQGIMRKSVLNEVKKSVPTQVLFFSTQGTEGKSLILDEYTDELRRLGNRVLMLSYSIEDLHKKFTHDISNHEDNHTYQINDSFFNVTSVDELISKDQNIETSVFDFITIEIPSIIHRAYPPALIQSIDFAVLIARANRTWRKADILSLGEFSSGLKTKPLFMLNGINVEYMEEFIGEVPRKRSRVRRILKKLVRLQVFERYRIKK